jgi:hypothetical protein
MALVVDRDVIGRLLLGGGLLASDGVFRAG